VVADNRWENMSIAERVKKIDSIRAKKKVELGTDDIAFLLWEIEWWRRNFGENLDEAFQQGLEAAHADQDLKERP
jgi:hypothetical protein